MEEKNENMIERRRKENQEEEIVLDTKGMMAILLDKKTGSIIRIPYEKYIKFKEKNKL